MKLIRASFLFIAMIIVVMHAVIPHRHHESSNSVAHFQEHEKANSIIDLLVIAFHHEQYEGQLEIYDASDIVDFEFQSFVAILPFFEAFQFEAELEPNIGQNNFDTREKSLTKGENSILDLRGPPTELV